MLSYDEINKLTSAYYEPMQLNKRQKKEREELSHVLFDFFQDMLIDLALLESESDDYEDKLNEITFQYKNGYVNTLEKYGFDLDKYDELKEYAPTLIQSVIEVTLDDKATKYTFDDKRALNMALNESNKVLNYSDFVDAVESGKTSKTWLTMNDDKVRDTHNDLEGMTIGIYSLFPVGVYQMAYPMDMSHGAGLEEVIGCRCSVDYDNKPIKETDYLILNDEGVVDATDERLLVNRIIANEPKIVQDAIHAGTKIFVGGNGSRYDYNNDIMYIAKGATKIDVYHEIGHLIENKILDADVVARIRKKIVGIPTVFDFKSDVYKNTSGEERNVIIFLNDSLIDEYHGRIYTENTIEAFDSNGNFMDDLLWEFVSKAYETYKTNPSLLKVKMKDMYDMFEGLK